MSDELDPSAPPVPPTVAPPSAPPAAAVVVNGEKTEREIALEENLTAERERHTATANDKKAREVRIAELEDELHRLKAAGAVPPSEPKPKVKRLAPGTFFEVEED